MLPLQLRPIFGSEFVELGVLFYLFLMVLAVFSTHAINILAGVNGLEVGQAVVVAVAVFVLNVVQLYRVGGDEEWDTYTEHQVSFSLTTCFVEQRENFPSGLSETCCSFF